MIHNLNVCLVLVTYNSDEKCLAYLESIARAYSLSTKTSLQVIVVDNSSRDISDDLFYKAKDILQGVMCVKTDSNTGYIGGVNFGMNYFRISGADFDYLGISNSDLLLDESFFLNLEAVHDKLPENTGVLGPAVINLPERWNSNPHLAKRPTKKRICFYKYLYSVFPLAFLYCMLGLLKKQLLGMIKSSSSEFVTGSWQTVYALHGSIFFLTKNFFLHGGSSEYPSFMFAEEIYFSEVTSELGLKCVYHPDLRVQHMAHESTGNVPSRLMIGYQARSINLVYSRFFKNKGMR